MRCLLLLCLLWALPAFSEPSKEPSKELNTAGFRLYQAGQYAQALEKFQAAVQADAHNALAQYNVAATLGVLRKQGKVCSYEAYRSTILQYLTQAVKLDSRRLKRAKEDADFDGIRDTVGWQRLVGLSPARVADVPELLRKVSWFGPGVGVYGTLVTLRFEEGGKVSLNRKIIQDEGPPKAESLQGTYSVKGQKIEVRLSGQKPEVGTLRADGQLSFKTLGEFSDSPSECDA